ncbi:IQ domain-containing protein F3 [Sorex araneus]|uniref:IQ domain-containing protein F3 n=1 Tax=Sorex araneus TaxID=42254 RepID=UPI002433A950|nr:IQ domain-containing protein F3 [Sorex araneus]
MLHPSEPLKKPKLQNIKRKKRKKAIRRVAIKKVEEVEEKPKQDKEAKGRSALMIQAWWRGTLVRRTLLAAALRALIIQRWWKMIKFNQKQELKQWILDIYVIQEQAAVKLQSWFRMWRCHHRYCRMCNAVCLFQAPSREHLAFPNAEYLQMQFQSTFNPVEFHIEILAI